MINLKKISNLKENIKEYKLTKNISEKINVIKEKLEKNVFLKKCFEKLKKLEEDLKKKLPFNEKITKIYMNITIIYIFFAHLAIFSELININIVYLIISILFLFYIILHREKNEFECKTIKNLIWFIGYLLISTTLLGWNIEAIEFLTFFAIINMIAIILRKKDDWKEAFIKPMLVCSLVHCFFTILHAIFPTAILNLDKLILRQGHWEAIKTTMKTNYYSGIASGPASAGLFAIILIGLSVSKIIVDKKIQYKNILYLIIGIVALMMSQKRAFMISCVIAVCIIIYLANRIQKRIKINKKNIKIFVLIMLIGIVVIMIIPQTKNIINRFVNGRLLSGRESFYNKMYEWFVSSPLIGKGIGTAQRTFGVGGHNVYIQMLAECGLIGASIYFTYLFRIVIENMKIIIKDKIIDNNLLFTIFMQIIFILYCITGNPIYDYSYLVLFMYLLMIPTVIKREKSNIEKDKCNNSDI